MRSDKRRIKLTKRNIRRITLIACLVLVLGIGVGGTVAYLYTNTQTVNNQFTPGRVTCEVVETFDNNIKSDVKVKNTGNTEAYIRATVIVNWVDADGNVCALTHDAPTITYTTDTKWTKNADGFWYYSDPVAPDAVTTKLIDSAESVYQADGCKLQIKVIASAIQAEGTGATANGPAAWGALPASQSGN